MNIRSHHAIRVIGVLIGFMVLQTAFALLSGMRSGQYYARIFYIIEIHILLTVSLSLINGFTGQFSIGHAGFMALGAYGSVVFTTILPRLLGGEPLSPHTVWGQFFFVFSIVAGGAVATVFGFLIGFPSLRLRGDYLAIVTLAAGEVIRALLRFSDFLGGPRGVAGIPRFANAFYIGGFLLLSLWIMRNFIYSHYGRACIAVRDNEIAASCMGIHTTFQKVTAFVLGAFFAGIGGGLFAHMSQYVNPDNFGILKSLEFLIFLYVGGVGSFAGAITGAAVFTTVPEIMRMANLESARMVIYPLILIAVMRFKPEGLMGKKEFSWIIPWKAGKMKKE